MSRSDFFQSYKGNLKRFYDFLTSNHEFRSLYRNESYGELETSKNVLGAVSNKRCITLNLPVCEFKIHDPVKCGSLTDSFISIGGRIKFEEDGVVDQSISVCLSIVPHEDIEHSEKYSTSSMTANDKYIVRRFHFDFDSNQMNGDRPISHIQYGGNINDEQKSDAAYHLISSIDLPRIPSLPLDVVQVFNFFMLQFENNYTKHFRKPAWRGILVENDSIWKRHYIEKLVNNTGKTKTLYEWACMPLIM